MMNLFRLALFASLTVFGTFLCIPLPYVWWGTSVLNHPELFGTLGSLQVGLAQTSAQLLSVCLAATTLNPWTAALSQAGYVLLGLCGWSVFGGGGGWEYAQASTFPYLLAFPLGAYLGARMGRGRGFGGRLRSLVLSLLLIWTTGTIFELAAASALSQLTAWWRLMQAHVQELPGLLLYLFPMALTGAAFDALTTLLRSSTPSRPVASRRASTTLPPVPVRDPLPAHPKPTIPAMPTRAKLDETTRRPAANQPERKLIEGPPRRTSLPAISPDPDPPSP